jgi:hypothetical protein
MIMFGTDNIILKKLNHAGQPEGHGLTILLLPVFLASG